MIDGQKRSADVELQVGDQRFVNKGGVQVVA
jgi:hypothetical protein